MIQTVARSLLPATAAGPRRGPGSSTLAMRRDRLEFRAEAGPARRASRRARRWPSTTLHVLRPDDIKEIPGQPDPQRCARDWELEQRQRGAGQGPADRRGARLAHDSAAWCSRRFLRQRLRGFTAARHGPGCTARYRGTLADGQIPQQGVRLSPGRRWCALSGIDTSAGRLGGQALHGLQASTACCPSSAGKGAAATRQSAQDRRVLPRRWMP